MTFEFRPFRVRNKSLLVLGCAMLMATPAAAVDEKGSYAVRGIGSDRCDALTAAMTAKDRTKLERYAVWLLGYLSASNRLISKTFDAVPSLAATDVLGMVALVCKNQPAVLVDTAASQALIMLSPIRLVGDSPIIEVSNSGRTMSVRKEALVALQRNLAAKHGYKGPIDGAMSPQLAKAITEFQQKEKLPGSGLPDLDTLIRAGLK